MRKVTNDFGMLAFFMLTTSLFIGCTTRDYTTETDTEPDTGTDTETSTDSDTGADSDTDTDADTDTDTDADTDSETDSDVDNDTVNIDTDTNIDTNTSTDTESSIVVCIPSDRNCRSSKDNNCNGTPDNQEPACTKCSADDTEVCDTHGDRDGQGICRAGTQTCEYSDEYDRVDWGDCLGAVGPQAFDCTTNEDLNCDGVADSQTIGCTCTPEQVDDTCSNGDWTGAPTPIGICHPGSRVCNAQGVWEACQNYQGPLAKDCSSSLDNDCNGTADNEENTCIPAELTISGDGTYGVAYVGKYIDRQFTINKTPGFATSSNMSIYISPVGNGFSILNNNCGTELSSSNSCTLTVRFLPDSRGQKSATLTVEYTTVLGAAQQTAALSGTGRDVARLTSNPGSNNFGNVYLFEPPGLVTLTISNTAMDTTATTVSASLNASVFTLNNGCGVSLAPGASCQIKVTFKPTAVGVKNGSLTLSYHNGSATTTTVVDLAGTGVNRCAGAITFPDWRLESFLRDEINKPTGDLFAANFSGYDNLGAGNLQITDIRGVQCLSDLKYLVLDSNTDLSDITPVSGLSSLLNFACASCNITDVSPLRGLTNLNYLNLSGNKISDMSPLAGMSSLTTAFLGQNNVSDITFVESLYSVVMLFLDNNNISSLNSLVALTNSQPYALVTLDIQGNPFSCNNPTVQSNISTLESRSVYVSSDCME